MRPVDRAGYIAALQTDATTDTVDRLLYDRLDATMDEYLEAAGELL